MKTAEAYRATDPAKTGRIFIQIANFTSAHGKPELADRMLAEAVASQQNAKDKGLLIGVLGKMAENKMAAGKKAEALPLYHQVSAAMREKYGSDMRVADAMDAEASVMKNSARSKGRKICRRKPWICARKPC